MADTRERILVAQPTIGRARVISAPFQVEVLNDEVLQVRGQYTQPGISPAVVNLTWRTLTPDGEILVAAQTFIMPQPRTKAATTYPLREGYLLSLSARVPVATTDPGALWIQAYITRTGGTEDLMIVPLLQGFPTAQQALVWPGSTFDVRVPTPHYQVQYRPADPPPGTNINITSPTTVEQNLVFVSFAFTTSAVAGNRNVKLVVVDQLGFGHSAYVIAAPFTQGPSATFRYVYIMGALQNTGPNTNAWLGALPQDFWLRAGTIWETVTPALDPGDQYSDLTYHVNERMIQLL